MAQLKWQSGVVQGAAVVGAALGVTVAHGAIRVTHGQYEIGDARSNFRPKAGTVEDAVMADAGLQPVGLMVGRYVRAQPVRCLGLADA